MTIAEMHAAVQLRVDKVGSYSTSNLIEGEVDDFLNEAINDFINQQKQLLREDNDVDRSALIQDNLYTLVESTETSNISTHPVFQEISTVDLSEFSDYDFFISGRANYDGEKRTLKQVSSSYIVDGQLTKYDSPFHESVPSTVEDDILLIRNPNHISSDPTEVKVSYLRVPATVNFDTNNASNNVDCDLPNDTHRDIVDLAVSNILQSLSGQTPSQDQG